ncbi:WXG100 family type VII secretion target [Nocardiopsis sediminis]|uniref:WXG100 family type VII secretion target n=1 Tax=Nocardiopsis sediminis TaxID=1778267 RepID=A0ABV8FM95_9ACTN
MSLTTSTELGMSTGREAMEAAYEECHAVYTQVDSLRDRLRGTWGGGAEQSFETALAKWLEELRLIVNGMNNMIGVFGGTRTGMLNVEDENLVNSSEWMNQLNPTIFHQAKPVTIFHYTQS